MFHYFLPDLTNLISKLDSLDPENIGQLGKMIACCCLGIGMGGGLVIGLFFLHDKILTNLTTGFTTNTLLAMLSGFVVGILTNAITGVIIGIIFFGIFAISYHAIFFLLYLIRETVKHRKQPSTSSTGG